jgi:hypothetical protein
MRPLAALMSLVILGATLPERGDSAPGVAVPEVAIYDSNPSHLWNRLYAALLVRTDRYGNTYGEDSLDPLLWLETDHLLSEPSHQLAMRILDEFLRTQGEALVHDTVKRAMLQRDLWAVFDWSAEQDSANERPGYRRERQELQVRLAEALRRVAPTAAEIKSLPDNYAQAVASDAFPREYDAANLERPFLPPDLFDPHGPWVCITPSPESDSAGVAKMHVQSFSGRSNFFVFMRLPGGLKATLDYFQSLWNFPQPWVQGRTAADDQAMVNPDLPPFPAGTQVALVRRMMLFDSQGNLAAAPITESVQIRVYHAITTTEERNFGNGNMAQIIRNSGQDFYEFQLSRPLLFAGKSGGLRAIGRDEKELSTFQQQGNDEIDEISKNPELRKRWLPELQTCAWCHSGGGVHSLNSRESLLRPNRMQKEPESPDHGPIYWEDSAALAWKQNHYDWGLLSGYWKAAARPQ